MEAEGAGRDEQELALDESARFARARAYYEANNYARCVEAFAPLLDPKNLDRIHERRLVDQARIYHAACLLGLGRTEEADEQMRIAIRDNPLISAPEPLVFPAAVVDRFFAVRAELLDEIRSAEEARVRELQREAARVRAKDQALRDRLGQLELLASSETVVQKNSRWVASIPFGVGQFQNRDTALGWLFLTSEALLLGATVSAVSVQLGLHAQANGGATTKDTDEINRRLRLAHAVEVVGLTGFLGVAVIGFVQAHWAYQSEIVLGQRPRTSPSEPKPDAGLKLELPEAQIGGEGASLLLRGTF